MLRFGLRAHDFGRGSPDQVAEALASFGVGSAQLAPSKSFPSVSIDQGSLSVDFARAVREAFASRGLVIAVLGCYINPVHPDEDELERQLARFEEHLRLAGAFGCLAVGTETGSVAPDCSYHPDTARPETFDHLCRSLERLLKAAEACGAKLGLEPVAHQHTISTIEAMGRLIRRFPSPSLKVIFDPVNLIPPTGLETSQGEFFAEALGAFGDRIVALHAKDFRMEGGRKSEALPAGSGELDYRLLFGLLRKAGAEPDVLLENASPATAPAALEALARAAGQEQA